MNKPIVTRRDEFNQILKSLTNFYGSENKKLLQLLIEKGVTHQEIANTLGVKRTAITLRLGGKQS